MDINVGGALVLFKGLTQGVYQKVYKSKFFGFCWSDIFSCQGHI